MLEARDLTTRYQALLAVDRVSFTINRGEILGYLGPNGSGKSTTINMVVGLLDATSGSLSLCGQRLDDDPEARVPEPRRRSSGPDLRLSWPVRRHPAYRAVQEFTSATLRRSGLHQLVFVGVFAAGFALAVNSILGSIGLSARWQISAALGAPLTLIVAAVVGLRAAMLLPANLRAAWVFRLTEDAGGRPHQLNAIEQVLISLGVIGPVALAFPIQAAVLGLPGALACVPVLALLGLVFVEIVVSHWRRIPLTCTLLFGNHPAAYTLVFAFLAFSVFVAVGTGLQQIAISQPLAWVIVVAILSLAAAALRWIRLQTWGRLPFEFEDYLPDRFETLGLQ